jgi:peptidoglycan hydrolase-like protein with peptidoglycan-binding domain
VIGKTTRKTIVAMVGATVGAAAVAVAPTASFAAAPTPTTPNAPTAAELASLSRAFANLSARPASTVIPSSQAAGDCDTFGSVFSTDGSVRVVFPAIDNGTNLNCALQINDNNVAVGKLQLALNDCFGQGLTIDNDFGPNTKHAVENVQTFFGLTANGIYDVSLVNAGFFYPILDNNNAFTGFCENDQGTEIHIG